MTKMTTHLTVQVPARRAAQTLPRVLEVGAAHLVLGAEETLENSFYGPERRRFDARWTKGRVGGAATVEVRPSSKLTSEIVLQIEAPDGFVKVLWSKQALKRHAALLTKALRYEVETRSDDEADGFHVRRTTPELVRARTA
jgi:hypothetical protein